MWGPRPPPQHGALLAGRLVLAAVGAAEGRTLVADVSPHCPTSRSCQSRVMMCDVGACSDTAGLVWLTHAAALSHAGPLRVRQLLVSDILPCHSRAQAVHSQAA